MRQDDSDDSSSSSSSSTSSEDQGLDDTATSSENEQKSALTALHSNSSGQLLANNDVENTKEVNKKSDVEPSQISTDVDKTVEAMDKNNSKETVEKVFESPTQNPINISKEESPSGSDCKMPETKLNNAEDSNKLPQTEEEEDKKVTQVEQKKIGTDQNIEKSNTNDVISQNSTDDKLLNTREGMKDDANLALESKKNSTFAGTNSIVTPPESTQHSATNDNDNNPMIEQSNVPNHESEKNIQGTK